jgi:hypothetical protein
MLYVKSYYMSSRAVRSLCVTLLVRMDILIVLLLNDIYIIGAFIGFLCRNLSIFNGHLLSEFSLYIPSYHKYTLHDQ